MTDRLYYDAPYRREFDAAVVRVERRDQGNDGSEGQTVWLDRSVFYPTTGGQPFDTGTLGACRVVDVSEDDQGDVIHQVEGPALSAGALVHGVIDWARRFDHMQQHTGQHVLSAAFVKLFGAKTISFHLGADASTIDVGKEVTADQIASAEDEANRIVWENRPVTIRYESAENAAALPLRKESKRAGTLRLIEVEGYDLSACGGTHVSQTGAIGAITVAGWERFKGGHRIEFLCGGRVVTRFRALRGVTAATVRLLSTLPEEVPGAIERLQAEARDQKRVVTSLQTDLARYQAREFAEAAESHPRARLVLQAVDADAAALNSLASAVVLHEGFVAVLVSRTAPALVVAARSTDVAIACHEIVIRLTKQFGGRGGGKPDLAQGGGLNGAPEDILAEARRLIVQSG